MFSTRIPIIDEICIPSTQRPHNTAMLLRATWVLIAAVGSAFGLGRRGGGAVLPVQSAAHPSTANCTVSWHEQPLDHFSFLNGSATYRQRYFVHDKAYRPGGPIWFYCGNEASVELYVNATGLMWENAAAFGALLVFGEHRYYGESQPFLPIDGSGNWRDQPLQYLTHEQAIADYALLIEHVRREHKLEDPATAVVAFGGSYGGMLAAWIRMKYPGTVDGAIAASAPILGFEGQTPAYDTNAFWRVVTRDASPDAGSDPSCIANVRATWPIMFNLAKSAAGLEKLRQLMRICPPTLGLDVHSVAMIALNAWDTLSMGNFPYPSNYLIFQQTKNPTILLPPWPVRVACKRMTIDTGLNTHIAAIATGEAGVLPLTDAEEVKLLERMLDATNVLNNASGAATCFAQPTDVEFDGIWDYQYCTQMLPQETYFSLNGTSDMFWSQPFSMRFINAHCAARFGGLTPRPHWIRNSYGGRSVGGAATGGTTNIVFSNGDLDPWSSGGVVTDLSDSVVAVMVEGGAHHLDLFFSNDADPQSVKDTRALELSHIKRWVEEKKAMHAIAAEL